MGNRKKQISFQEPCHFTFVLGIRSLEQRSLWVFIQYKTARILVAEKKLWHEFFLFGPGLSSILPIKTKLMKNMEQIICALLKSSKKIFIWYLGFKKVSVRSDIRYSNFFIFTIFTYFAFLY